MCDSESYCISDDVESIENLIIPQRKRINLVCQKPDEFIKRIPQERVIVSLSSQKQRSELKKYYEKMNNKVIFNCQECITDEVIEVIEYLRNNNKPTTVIIYYPYVPDGISKIRNLMIENKDIKILNFIKPSTFIDLHKENTVKKYSFVYFDYDPQFHPQRINKNLWNIAWSIFKKHNVLIGDEVYHLDNKGNLFSIHQMVRSIVSYFSNSEIKLNNPCNIVTSTKGLMSYLNSINVEVSSKAEINLLGESFEIPSLIKESNASYLNKIAFYYHLPRLGSKVIVTDSKYNILGYINVPPKFRYPIIDSGCNVSRMECVFAYGISPSSLVKIYNPTDVINANSKGYKQTLIDYMSKRGKVQGNATLLIHNIRRMNNELDLLLRKYKTFNIQIVFSFKRMVNFVPEYLDHISGVLFDLSEVENGEMFYNAYIGEKEYEAFKEVIEKQGICCIKDGRLEKPKLSYNAIFAKN